MPNGYNSILWDPAFTVPIVPIDDFITYYGRTGSFKHSRSLLKAIVSVDVQDGYAKNALSDGEKMSTEALLVSEERCKVLRPPDGTLHRLATLNAVSNLGFVVGPIFIAKALVSGDGGGRSDGLRHIFELACLGYLVNIGLVFFTYHHASPRATRSTAPDFRWKGDTRFGDIMPTNPFSKFSITNLTRQLFLKLRFDRSLRDLMAVRFLMVSAVLVFRHDLYRHLTNHFPNTFTAYVISLSSASSSGASLFAVALTTPTVGQYLAKYFSKSSSTATLNDTWLYTLTSLLYASSMLWTGVWMLTLKAPFRKAHLLVLPIISALNIAKVSVVGGILVNSLCNSWCRTLLDDLVIKYASGDLVKVARPEHKKEKSSVGELIGIGQSVSSLARIVAPLIAGTCQELIHFDAPLLVGGILAFMGSYILLTKF